MKLLSNSQQIRKADQQMIDVHAFPGVLLMETAGRKCAEWILSHRPAAHLYYVLVGPGNNGGDGLVIARYLQAAGKPVELLFATDPAAFSGDAAIQWGALKGSGIVQHHWPCALPPLLATQAEDCLLIDALLGTGAQAPLRGPIAEIVAECARLHVPTVAIDLPSGLSADTGASDGNLLQAQATLTFQCPKICHYVYPAAKCCGEIVVLDIGIWPEVMRNLGIRRYVLEADLGRVLYRQRAGDGHKGTFGHVLCVGGSKPYAGAIALTGMAALQGGAGLSTVFTTETGRCAVYPGRAELMVVAAGHPDAEWLDATALPALQAAMAGKTALVVGPGLGNAAPTCNFLQGLLQAWGRPLVIDADGLNILSSEPELWRWVPQGSILTPHPGEMARLLPGAPVQAQRLEVAERLARDKQVIVVLKGAGTIVAMPNGKTYVNTSGNDGMATGGAGDVLTGLLGALLAQGYAPEEAALLGVFLHGCAGDRAATALGAREAVTASAIAAQIGHAWAGLQ